MCRVTSLMNLFKTKINLQELLKTLRNAKPGVAPQGKKSFIKADKQVFVIIGIAFAVAAVTLLCYWLFMERPYYEKLIANKDELIKTLKFTRDKQRKIHENAVAAYEEKLANEYVLKSLHDGKVRDYEQKINSYQTSYVTKSDHENALKDLELRLKEGESSKNDLEQKITPLEQKVSILEDKNLDQKRLIEKSLGFIHKERDRLEAMLVLQRKKAFIPSLILPETKNSTISTRVLKELVSIKDRLKDIEDMNVALKPETYFNLGLVSYYNKQYSEATEQWENAVSLDKNNLKAYLCLGLAYQEQNMSDNAIKVLKRANEINPRYATIHLALARIYEQKNSIDDAILEYSKVIDIAPQTIDVHNALGALYEKKGLRDEARNSFALYEKLKGERK